MTGLFLLGTDTAVGKTSLARGLLHLGRIRGKPLAPYKPAETGCDPEPRDAVSLIIASGLTDLDVGDVCPYALKTPVAPSVAARLEGQIIDPSVLVQRASILAGRGLPLLVEGAGGLLSPYGPNLDGAGLAKLLGLDVLLVSANRLGTINQTLLALEALERRKLRCRGVVLTNLTAALGPDSATNASELQRITGQPPLGTMRYLVEPSTVDLALAASADLDLTGLFDGALVERPS